MSEQKTEKDQAAECLHERVRQISEHDVECIDCGLVGA